MTIANTEMAAAWDGPEGEHWTDNADRYDATSPRIHDRFFATVPIKSGDTIVDIGCGTGQFTREAAHRAAQGSVRGLDLSSKMLDEARRRAARDGLTNVSFEQADVQVHPFDPDSFDLAMSSYGAMFFSDPVAAFGNIAGGLKSDGRLALLAWRDLLENEWLVGLRTALAMGRELGTPPVGAPSPFALADQTHTTDVLTKGGFTDVSFEAIDEPMYFGTDAKDAFAFVKTMGIVKGLSHDLEPADAAQGLHNVEQLLVDHETADGVLIPSATWLITARKA